MKNLKWASGYCKLGNYYVLEPCAPVEGRKAWIIKSPLSGAVLGKIEWWRGFDGYAVMENAHTGFDASRLRVLLEFIEKQNSRLSRRRGL